MTDIVKAVVAHNGDYIAAAEDLGLRPYKVRDAWRKAARASKDRKIIKLDGAIEAYETLGQRLKTARRLQRENTDLRRDLRHANDLRGFNEALINALERDGKPLVIDQKRPSKHAGNYHEILFGDLHYGKKCHGYDINIAAVRVYHYAAKVKELQAAEKPVATRIAFLGDLIENSNKHRDSRSGCSIDTAEQVVGAYRLIRDWLEHILPTAGKVQVVGVAGNHENILGAGSQLNYMGNAHTSHIIYQLLRDHFKKHKIHWVLPEGSFAVIGDSVYEHGDLAQPTEQDMAKIMLKRSRQADRMCNKYRQGDKHVAVAADGGNLVCNGAFFSDRAGTEFSGTRGYCSDACQVVISSAKDRLNFVRFD